MATITLSLLVWPIGFNLGAYGVVFYDDMFRMVVATAATLGVVVVVSSPGRRVPWYVVLALASPACWLVAAVLLFDSVAEAARSPGLGTIGLAIVVVSMPITLRILVMLFNPELTGPADRRVRFGSAVIVVGAALAGFVVGANNDAFLVCDDFKVAGADLPANCADP
ncbi:MAG: hypothetical protein ACR2QO_00015 [Acidimicrobiales bacterium]